MKCGLSQKVGLQSPSNNCSSKVNLIDFVSLCDSCNKSLVQTTWITFKFNERFGALAILAFRI